MDPCPKKVVVLKAQLYRIGEITELFQLESHNYYYVGGKLLVAP